MMIWAIVVVCIIVAWKVLWKSLAAYRVLYKGVPKSRAFTRYLCRFLRGRGTPKRVFLLHRSSGILIEARKDLQLEAGPPFPAQLSVLKRRVVNPGPPWQKTIARLLAFGSSMSRKNTDPVIAIPFFGLPDPDAAEELLAVDCGASLARVTDAIDQIVLDDPVLSRDPFFDLWGLLPDRKGVREAGVFEEDETADGDGEESGPAGDEPATLT